MDTPNRSDVTVLIAEDSRIQAQILSQKLTSAGFDVRLAENGAVALQSIRQDRPTLVISDIEMPEMTGYELCSAMKEDPELRTIPFILLSPLSEPQDIIRGLHCGADNYVTKPYDPDFLIGRVESLLTTPLGDQMDVQKLEVALAGETYTVNSSSQQVLNLLVSTFENAVEKNNELIKTNQELTLAKEQLTVWNEKLEELNGQLESANNRMSRDLNAAAKVQQSLLPATTPETPVARFAWKYLPCDELAGDFLNVFPLDDKHVAVFVVDVSGHGVASSLLSVTIGRLLTPHVTSSSLLVQQVEGSDEPRIVPPLEVAQELNRRFPMREQNGLYFTMAYGILNLETLEFRHVLAGHPQLIRVPKSGAPESLDITGMAIGWVPDLDCEEHVIQLQPGDRLYLYSDGVPEAMDPDHKQFGSKQMLEVMELGRRQSLEESVALLLSVVERWGAYGSLQDDVSILGLEIPG
ncbi:MAG: PP2C family protein-serine/threonine phosphatase [Planctomycetota bacterium]|jgi:sigma-B regulation protein RsbU (phosphoserine phosphatase)